MFGPSKTLKLTYSRAGQPPRASQAHSHDSISVGRLPGLLLPLPPQYYRKVQQVQVTPTGHLADTQPLYGRGWSRIFPRMIYRSLQSEGVITPNAGVTTSPGSVLAHFLLRPGLGLTLV